MVFLPLPRCQAAPPPSRSSSFPPSKPLFLLAAFLSSVARRSGNEPGFYIMSNGFPVRPDMGASESQVHELWCMNFGILLLKAYLSLGLCSCSLTAVCVLNVQGRWPPIPRMVRPWQCSS